MDICALVLAGGKSSRMNGNNKAFLEYNNKTFIENVISKLNDFNKIYVSVDNKDKYEKLSYDLIEDEYKDIGPIGGIYSALKHIDYEYVFVIACDMPKVTKEFINFLLNNLTKEDKCLIVKDHDNKLYPLGGIYSKGVLPVIEEMIKAKDYKLQNLVKKCNGRILSLKDASFYESSLINVNNPEEYEKLKEDFQ